MSLVILINNIEVQNANAVAGLTYGFPAITHFLGFVHGLSRRLPEEWGASFGGVGVVCHRSQVHAKRPSQYADFVFALSRNPLKSTGDTAAFNEEGRMNMRISLVVELKGLNVADEHTPKKVQAFLDERLGAMRLAGGQIINQPELSVFNCHEASNQRKLLRALMPGFALIDRRSYLQEHYAHCLKEHPATTLLDAWCNFAALRYRAEKVPAEHGEDKEKIEWNMIKRTHGGYLVPMMVGYCGLSDEPFPPGEVAAVRDPAVPAIFAEAAYSIAEWLSPHRLLDNFDGLFWQYQYDAPWYVASTEALPDAELDISNNTETDTSPYYLRR